MLETMTPATNASMSAAHSKSTISILTATFNADEFLPALIASLRAQTDRDFEWIVVDGGSTDTTVDVIKSAGDIVSVWISEPDFGIYDALNKAIRLASGDYYLVLGADDRLLPEAIAQYRSHARQSQADIITAGIVCSGKTSFGSFGKSWLHGMFAYVSGHSVGTLIRRSLHDRFGAYSRRFHIAADMYFLKTVCQAPSTALYRADFVAGEHGGSGISSQDKAATFCDCFRVQLETEPGKLLQVILFIAKIVWRMPDLVRQSAKRRAPTPDGK